MCETETGHLLLPAMTDGIFSSQTPRKYFPECGIQISFPKAPMLDTFSSSGHTGPAMSDRLFSF